MKSLSVSDKGFLTPTSADENPCRYANANYVCVALNHYPLLLVQRNVRRIAAALAVVDNL